MCTFARFLVLPNERTIKNIYFTNKQTIRFMKKVYAEPTLVIEEVVVESGIAQSTALVYGEQGYAGSNGSVTVYDYEDL